MKELMLNLVDIITIILLIIIGFMVVSEKCRNGKGYIYAITSCVLLYIIFILRN